MSPLVILGSLGTLVSTVSMMPHLVHAIRNRGPAGSAFAWFFGAFSSAIWLTYGLAIHDPLVAAPGFVTVPTGLGLGAWALMRTLPPRLTEGEPLYLPAEWGYPVDRYASAGDTLEMPRVLV